MTLPEAARKRGKRIGRPFKLTKKQIRHAHAEITAGNTTIAAIAKQLGCSRDTLSKAFKRLKLNF